MARIFLLQMMTMMMVALCVFPAIVTAGRPNRNPFAIQGRVYCDTCRAGFETPASTYVAGATVRVECKNRKAMTLAYSKEAKTDSSGTYKILVDEDHEDEFCDVMLVRSLWPDCSKASPGRDHARVFLTRYNGMASNTRFANNIGFEMDKAVSGCAEILRQYREDED